MGYMSQWVYVQGRGQVSGGMFLGVSVWGICPWGTCPGGYMLGGEGVSVLKP